MKPDLLVVDARHLLHRVNDAFKQLTAMVDGVEIATGGIYGWLGGAIRLHQKFRCRLVAAWEGDNNFRFKLWPGYKKRDVSPELDLRTMDIEDQQRRLQELLQHLGVSQYAGIGCEADDVMGRLSRLSERGKHVVIYSGDSDMRQLVSERVTVVAPTYGKDVVYDAAKVREHHGIPAALISDMKALAGDSSDKIPGAKGIGEVTAVKLLNHYGSLEAILQAAEKGDPKWPLPVSSRKKIANDADQVRLFHLLTRIRTDLPMEAIKPKKDRDQAIRLMKLYKFRSLVFSAAELGVLLRMGGK